MKLEYLFSGTDDRDVLSNYTYNPKSESKSAQAIKVSKDIYDIDGTDKWILSFTLTGENETTARHLSFINDEIMNYEPTILTNESSAYFNKTIYPLINEFERKLRKYLYLKICIYNEGLDDEKKITIEDKNKDNKKNNKNKMVLYKLESMDFGDLYIRLFTDENVIKSFNQKVQSRVSSKSYYIGVLSEIEENTIWDTIKGVREDDCIKNNFLTITDYRNDTMHAHNVAYSDYLKQKNMFKKANEFLDNEIDRIIKQPPSTESAQTITSALYNRTIPEAFRNSLGDIESYTDQQIRRLSELSNNFSESISAQYEIGSKADIFDLVNSITSYHDAIRKATEPCMEIMEYERKISAMHEALNPCQALQNEINKITSSINTVSDISKYSMPKYKNTGEDDRNEDNEK